MITCPKCEEVLNCNCKNCNKCEKTGKEIILLYDESLYQCPFCESKFSESESMDYEWDKMIEGWAKVATPEHCIYWLENKKKIEEELDFNDFMMKQSFFKHFNQHSDKVEDIKQFKRDYKLSKILN